MEGGGGMAVTTLTSNITAVTNSIPVTSTQGFMSTGVIFIESEKIAYTTMNTTNFNTITRGYEDTTARPHPQYDKYGHNTEVYNEDAGIINGALGFNPAAIAASNGWFAIVLIPWDFFTITMPRLILWNFSFFQGDLIMVRYILMAISIAFYVMFAIQLGQTIAYALRR